LDPLSGLIDGLHLSRQFQMRIADESTALETTIGIIQNFNIHRTGKTSHYLPPIMPLKPFSIAGKNSLGSYTNKLLNLPNVKASISLALGRNLYIQFTKTDPEPTRTCSCAYNESSIS